MGRVVGESHLCLGRFIVLEVGVIASINLMSLTCPNLMAALHNNMY